MITTFDVIKDVFQKRRYELTRETAKVIEFQAPTSEKFIYIPKERDPSVGIRVVVDPRLLLDPLLNVPGIRSSGSDLHHSNMRQFPKKKNRGESEIHYGRPLDISSLMALGALLDVYDKPSEVLEEGESLPSRIIAIELENFKGVASSNPPARIDLAPVTLLFGANSAGKSTILHSLLYLREILERRNTNPDRTLHGGAYVDFGGFRNLVHGRDLTRPIRLKLELALNREELPDLTPEAWDEWQTDEGEVWDFYQTLRQVRERITTVSIGLEISWSVERQKAVITGYEVGTNGDWVARLTAQTGSRDVTLKLNRENEIFVRYKTQKEIEEEVELLAELASESSDSDISPEGSKSIASVDGDHAYSELPGLVATVLEAGLKKAGDGFRSWLTGLDGALPRLGEALSIPTPGVRGAKNIYLAREFTAFLSSLIIGPAILIRNELRKLRYVGPIRNVPDRNFAATLSPDDSHWADGTAAWETLLNADEKLVTAVSDWMSDEDKLRTGYEVERTRVKELDSGHLTHLLRALDGATPPADLLEQSAALPETVRLHLVETESRLRLQPRDVGIGISQVLPVVVAALEPSAGLVAIEQPELHIHPAVQIGLGDLFIEGAIRNGLGFLVETHSEHLLLRLLRRIRETSAGELPQGLLALRPDQVAVIYVERDEAGVKLMSVPIDTTGEFAARWPKGFFEERAGELF